MYRLLLILIIVGCSESMKNTPEIDLGDALRDFCVKNYCEAVECPEIPQPSPCPECPECPEIPVCPTPIPTPEPTPTATPTQGVARETFTGSSLWKPKSDSDSNPVLLIRNFYRKAFNRCVAERKDGSFETLRFAGFSNPDRQTYRMGSRCSAYSSPHVICTTPELKLIIKDSGKPCQRHD